MSFAKQLQRQQKRLYFLMRESEDKGSQLLDIERQLWGLK
jgi:hypothetical protein